MEYMDHKHHIIPKHEWKRRFGSLRGIDALDNVVVLSITQHAEAHRWLWEQYGRWEDECAWKGTAGIIGKEEIIHRILSVSKLGNSWNKGVSKTEEHKKNISLGHMGMVQGPPSKEHRRKLSIALSGPKNPMYGKDRGELMKLCTEKSLTKKQCPHCGLSASLGNSKRWHFDNCKRRTL